MLKVPMDVLTAYPVRKSKAQKQAFRDDVQALASSWGYESTVEKGSFGARNLAIGDPEKAAYLVTAHYDTCARMPFPNLITPCNFWAFIGYQLLIAAIMVLLPLIISVPVERITHDADLAFRVWYLMFWVVFALLLFGPANKTNANDNTSGVVAVLTLAHTLPQEVRSKVCFVLFDLEEAGLLGSSGYQSKHKTQTKKQLILNLDCVGDGDEILLVPTKKLKKDPLKMAALRVITGPQGEKNITLHEKGFSVYPSDQANFPYGVGIAAFHCSRIGLYMNRIHTHRDTILEEENIKFLRDRILMLISGGAVQ